MGFFSDLVDMAPHRTAAHHIKEYCIQTVLNDAESNFILEFKIDKNQFIWLRNTINLCVYRAYLIVLEGKHPNTYLAIVRSYLERITKDFYYSEYTLKMLNDLNVPLPDTYGLWNEYFQNVFIRGIEDKNNTKLDSSAIHQLYLLTKQYQIEIEAYLEDRYKILSKKLEE